MIRCNETDEEVRGFDDKSSRVELVSNNLARQILWKHDYKPITLLNYSTKLFSGSLSHLNPGTDYGTDDILHIDDIPAKDPLNFKENKPFNNFVGFYSIDYKSHQFRDNEINVMLMKLKPDWFYTEERYYRLLRRGKANRYRLQGLLSKEKQTDFFFFIKRTTNRYNKDIEPNCLINAYLIPAISLKRLIMDNLNVIRENHGLSSLKLEENDKDKSFKIYQTLNIYREIKAKVRRNYKFRLFSMEDNGFGQDSLMMKIPEEHLLKYIKFNEKGDIIEKKP